MTTTTEMVAALVNVGGSMWERGTMSRVYFNDLSKFFGLRVSYYNSGNVSSATLNGEPVSNSTARSLLRELDGKLWYDVTTGKWMHQLSSKSAARTIISEIKRLAGLE